MKNQVINHKERVKHGLSVTQYCVFEAFAYLYDSSMVHKAIAIEKVARATGLNESEVLTAFNMLIHFVYLLGPTPANPNQRDMAVSKSGGWIFKASPRLRKKPVSGIKESKAARNMMDAWSAFYRTRTGVNYSWNAGHVSAARLIAASLAKLVKVPANEDIDSAVVQAFEFILDSWDRLDPWTRDNCMDVRIFNSKLNSIIYQLKKHDASTSTNGIDQAISDRFNRQ